VAALWPLPSSRRDVYTGDCAVTRLGHAVWFALGKEDNLMTAVREDR